MVGEMSVRGNALVGKCPVREVSFGEVSGRGIVRSGKCLSWKCPSGKCQSRICPRGSVSWGSVRLGKCPTIEYFQFEYFCAFLNSINMKAISSIVGHA